MKKILSLSKLGRSDAWLAARLACCSLSLASYCIFCAMAPYISVSSSLQMLFTIFFFLNLAVLLTLNDDWYGNAILLYAKVDFIFLGPKVGRMTGC